MYKKLALAILAATAFIVGIVEIDQWVYIEHIADQGLYKVMSIEKSPDDGTLREIRIDSQASKKPDIGWYAGDLMSSFSFAGDARKVQLGSVIFCTKKIEKSLISGRMLLGSAHYRCSMNLEGPGNRRVLAFCGVRLCKCYSKNRFTTGTGDSHASVRTRLPRIAVRVAQRLR